MPPERFVVFSANHDQVGNRAFGERLPPEAKPLAALCTLLSPFTPMIFQGDEYGEQAPFQFFTDHIDEDIATATREGRRREFAAFAEFRAPRGADPRTRRRSRRPSSRARANPGLRELHAAPPARPPRLRRRRRRDRPRRARRLAARAARPFVLLANFSRRATHVPLDGSAEVVVAAGRATLEPGYVLLASLSGALVRIT